MGRVESIDEIGASPSDARIEMARKIMGLDEATKSDSGEFSASSASNLTAAADIRQISNDNINDINNKNCLPPADDVEASDKKPNSIKTVAETNEKGNMEKEESVKLEEIKDTDNDGTPDNIDVNPNGDVISPATQAFLDEMFSQDTDCDGILDFLDKTGSKTQIENWRDNVSKMDAETVRAFTALMAIFGHLDLTKFPNQYLEPGGDSLTIAVASGAAQVALMHSASLQNLPPNAQFNKEDIKKLIELYKKQSNENKLKNLEMLNRFVDAMPETNPMRATLKAICKPPRTT
jgi:hypothetical protein